MEGLHQACSLILHKRVELSLQKDLAAGIINEHPNATIKKVDKDNYLDIHLPDVDEDMDSHLFFNTSDDKFKIGFHANDRSLFKKVLMDHGAREDLLVLGNDMYITDYKDTRLAKYEINPKEYTNDEDALNAALAFIKKLGSSAKDLKDNRNKVITENAKVEIITQSVDGMDSLGVLTIPLTIDAELGKAAKQGKKGYDFLSKLIPYATRKNYYDIIGHFLEAGKLEMFKHELFDWNMMSGEIRIKEIGALDLSPIGEPEGNEAMVAELLDGKEADVDGLVDDLKNHYEDISKIDVANALNMRLPRYYFQKYKNE